LACWVCLLDVCQRKTFPTLSLNIEN
jgi:hypothetical protein